MLKFVAWENTLEDIVGMDDSRTNLINPYPQPYKVGEG
jgi:hypothetical protein